MIDKNILSLLSLVLFMFVSQTVFAQSIYRSSSSNEVAMIFYKTGQSVPNFTKWVERSKEFQHTPWALREDKLKEEREKLAQTYEEIDLLKSLIRVKVPINLSLNKEIIKDKELHSLSLNFRGAENVDYFPYQFAKQNIAVIPTNLKLFRKNIISLDKYNQISEYLKKANKNSIKAFIELQAYEADLTQPHDLDGTDQWILKTKIAVMTIIDNKDYIIWERMEPWYISPTTHTLNDLYQGQYEKEPDYINTQ